MGRSERRRQERENRKAGKAMCAIYSGRRDYMMPAIHQFIAEHEGHTLEVEDNLTNSLTLSCLDCEDVDEIGEG
jgi:hypothetical protein